MTSNVLGVLVMLEVVIFKLTSERRQREFSVFVKSQEEHSKLKVRHNRMHMLHMSDERNI